MDLSITGTAGGGDAYDEMRTNVPRRFTESGIGSSAGTFARNGPAVDVSTYSAEYPRPRSVTEADLQSSAASPRTGPFPPKSSCHASSDLKALADVRTSPAPHVLRTSPAPHVLRTTHAPPVVDRDGFTLVRSRKYGMIRGRFPDLPVPVPPVHCDPEVPWGAWYGGCLRLIRKHYQARRSGIAVTSEGPGHFVYGSYGPDGHEV